MTLTLAQQQFALNVTYPGTECRVHRGVLTWRGWLQPTPLSRPYQVLIRYDGWCTPRVYVKRPALREIADAGFASGRSLPHVYPEKEDPLCLFEGEKEWNRGKFIAKTTVPWASLWLYYFEIWVMTNTWEGSGAPYSGRVKAA